MKLIMESWKRYINESLHDSVRLMLKAEYGVSDPSEELINKVIELEPDVMDRGYLYDETEEAVGLKQEKHINLQEGLDSIAQELGVELDIEEYPKGILTLSRIVVPEDKRGQGLGTVAMKKIIEYADANQLVIALTPSSDFGGNKSRLTKFYKGFGFVMNKGRNKNYQTRETMIRDPQ